MTRPTSPSRAPRGVVLALGAMLAGCAGAGMTGPLTYTYPPALPAVYAPDAALGAVAFLREGHLDLYLPVYHGDTRRRPERFSFRPAADPAGTWVGHPYRLPQWDDIVARRVDAAEALPDPRTGHRVALLPPGALAVRFPAKRRYGALAGTTVFLVPAGMGTRNSPPAEAALTAWQPPR
jgi:hypothetical protein